MTAGVKLFLYFSVSHLTTVIHPLEEVNLNSLQKVQDTVSSQFFFFPHLFIHGSAAATIGSVLVRRHSGSWMNWTYPTCVVMNGRGLLLVSVCLMSLLWHVFFLCSDFSKILKTEHCFQILIIFSE